MQREIQALMAALNHAQQGRANVQAILQDILWAIQAHGTAISEADRKLLDHLERAIMGTQPQPPQHYPVNGSEQWGRYNG
jgi:transcription initiation factor TFIIIB Brf1 subunit/transcription initiation factor TFIIB